MIHKLIIEFEDESEIAEIKELAERLGASVTITPKHATSPSETEPPIPIVATNK